MSDSLPISRGGLIDGRNGRSSDLSRLYRAFPAMQPVAGCNKSLHMDLLREVHVVGITAAGTVEASHLVPFYALFDAGQPFQPQSY